MGFEKFTGGGRSYEPKLTIGKSGLIGMNDGMRKRYGIDKYAYCLLHYDRERNLVGVSFTNNAEDPGARRIRLRETGADVSAKPFLDYFGIEHKETATFPVSDSSEEGGPFLVVDISEGKKRRKSGNVDSV